ncbi:putative mitochondrial protein [Cucumis melo var. makuwa]|uniref:Mitochondrial protein n=1 Tax=Cucumis melo var. makuwa TaxID=1194695 RepID=A0A5A7TI00_CUCMM|nr:putative mitochondrial protein [Cucumis melo var. makuwa]TYK16046.1 putative mitochondrial protein [Cucumis melo var. makuwa]
MFNSGSVGLKEQDVVSGVCGREEIWSIRELQRILKKDFTIDRVVEERRPYPRGPSIAYKSRKLNSVEMRYTVSKKEMLVVVHCLKAWRQYLLESPFVVKYDNSVICHFFSQPKFQHAAMYKVEKAKAAEVLEPLLVPMRLWKSISMDFITYLPKVGDLEAILLWRVSMSIVSDPNGRLIDTFWTELLTFLENEPKHILKLPPSD